MRLPQLVNKTSGLVNYLRMRKKDKLYRQWIDKAGLPLEAVPRKVRIVQPVLPKIDKR